MNPRTVPADGLPWLGADPVPDCRSCALYADCLKLTVHTTRCYRGSLYVPAVPVMLWRQEVPQ